MVQAKCLANALLHWAPWFSLLSISWLVPSVAFQMVQIRTRMIQAGRSTGGQVLGAQLTSKLGQTAQNLVWCSTKRLQGWRARKRSGLITSAAASYPAAFPKLQFLTLTSHPFALHLWEESGSVLPATFTPKGAESSNEMLSAFCSLCWTNKTPSAPLRTWHGPIPTTLVDLCWTPTICQHPSCPGIPKMGHATPGVTPQVPHRKE